MKGLYIIITMLISFGANAQDPAYKGPGKVEVNSFWRQVETFKNGKGTETTLGNMKRALDNLKQKDPSYNAGSMEDEYKKWKAEIDKVTEAGKTDEQKAADKKVNGYAGPAAKQVAYFWERAVLPVDKISESVLNGNIRDMEYAVKTTKEKDPSYDVAEMEATLKKIKDDLKSKKLEEVRKTSGSKEASRPAETVSNDPAALLEKLFIDNNISVGSTADLPQAPAKIEAYKSKTDKLLSMDYSDALVKKGRFAKGNISGFTTITNRELDKVDDYLKEADDISGMQYIYYTIQFHLAYWNAAQKIFTEESSYADMYKKVVAAASKIGSLDQLQAKATANRIERIKNTKLPVTSVKDTRLEKILTDGFNAKFGDKATALKAVLVQNGWTTLRNNISGIVTGRERSAKLAYKGKDGKCYLLEDYIFIHEEYIGGSFTNTKAVFNGLFGSEMLCENVK